MVFPTLFISHGSPMVAIENSAARDFLGRFGRELGRPEAILVASAHFEASRPLLTADAEPEMIYDFGGFPRALYDMQYPAPGSPALARRAVSRLEAAGFAAAAVEGRGFDHGTWVPLKLLYPEADIPVVQLSVEPQAGAAHHVALGRALASLREERVLIIGSGSVTHNLAELFRTRRDLDAPAPAWVTDFGAWVHDRIAAGAVDDIENYRTLAPFARENHPSEEHFLPLPFAMGAAGEKPKGKRVHTSHQYGVLMMDAYAFE
jgi:4,5-DOPA dioxygenase extradiol